VNDFVSSDEAGPEILQIGREAEDVQLRRLREVRSQRDAQAVESSLNELKRAAETTANLMPFLLDCTRSYATIGEICGTLKEVFGTYTEPEF
jgi:methylmalonyl-CoA mutase N-terminal domain/subunit